MGIFLLAAAMNSSADVISMHLIECDFKRIGMLPFWTLCVETHTLSAGGTHKHTMPTTSVTHGHYIYAVIGHTSP